MNKKFNKNETERTINIKIESLNLNADLFSLFLRPSEKI